MPNTLPLLPIDDALPTLQAGLADKRAAVLVAPPGAGKTTRVPLALLDATWRGDGRIIVLEPRRLAARAAAHQMARLIGENVGQTVGYRVRLDSKVSGATRIEVVTEGVFTRMVLDDPELPGVAAVLFDEFHERSMDADLGLALALDATALRPDLRILVMSATLDGARVSALLDDAAIIESAGRMHAVETRYAAYDASQRLEPQVARTVLEALDAEPGSALVFLPGQAEIVRVARALEERVPGDTDILPLFGRLTSQEQDRAIQPAPEGRRKVVLATAIAETSLTISGVRIVVDSGLSRRPIYDPATGLSRLVTRRVSRASADQRRGRAGRVEPGVCYRMWAEGQTAGLVPFDPPEILQADLAGLVLDLASIGVRDPATLRFLDPPPAPAWAEGVALLRALEALEAGGGITERGRQMAALPMHPRLAHMLLAAVAESGAGTASLLGAVLAEPGLGGSEVDIALRLDRVRTERSSRSEAARDLARNWRRIVGAVSDAEVDAGAVGHHLARAYPDRVAQAAGAPGRFRLANGRAAALDPSHPLARERFLVVTDIAGTAANARIHSAARLDDSSIEHLFADRIFEQETIRFDRDAGAVRARQSRTLGALVLDERTAPVVADAATVSCLAEGIADLGVDRLPWSKAHLALLARAGFLARRIGEAWPDLSDAALARDGADWLVPHIAGATKLADITPDMLDAALFDLLPWGQRQEMERTLPSHFEAPSGSRLPIDYGDDNGPTLRARPQELFGLDVHPSIASGRIPLLVVLLSPAQRPIQTTRDLPGFWKGSWREVARDLKGRYPRHFWPEDPLSAAATSRAKPRAG